MTKLRVVVLDGMDWEFTKENRDVTSPLWRIAADGCCGRLEACDPPVTSTAVAALLAGRDVPMPFINGDRYTTSQDIIRTRPWIYEAARNGVSVGLCNVPLTWPAFPVPEGCWLTSGYPVGPSRYSWPGHLPMSQYPIEDLCLDSRSGPGGDAKVDRLGAAEAQLVDWFFESAWRCDLEVIWLRVTDAAGHHHWGSELYENAVRWACLRAGELRAENVVVISDHGFDAVGSPRCAAYMDTEHGPTTLQAGLKGGHTMDGILFAAGDRILARGELEGQKLMDVAGGIFDLLQVPPPPGMHHGDPRWATAMSPEQEELLRDQLKEMGYL